VIKIKNIKLDDLIALLNKIRENNPNCISVDMDADESKQSIVFSPGRTKLLPDSKKPKLDDDLTINDLLS